MRVMVTGSRDWRDLAVIRKALEDLEIYNPNRSWSLVNVNFDFATANKNRNMAMVDSRPDLIYAFPTHGSRGTWHAVRYAQSQDYVLDENLFIFSEQEEVRRTKDIAEYPRSS